MNWQLVGWFAGVMITFGAIKFIWAFFRALTGKEARQKAISAMGNKITDGAEELSDYISKKATERKKRKLEKKLEEERPMIVIR